MAGIDPGPSAVEGASAKSRDRGGRARGSPVFVEAGVADVGYRSGPIRDGSDIVEEPVPEAQHPGYLRVQTGNLEKAAEGGLDDPVELYVFGVLLEGAL